MKAQNVKNTRHRAGGRQGRLLSRSACPPAARARTCRRKCVASYQTFIRGLLDVTDNIVERQDRRAATDVVRRDGDDAYLVVAADKGTATFSDIANAISIEYGHWLGDAFASGGSAGYDHKGMGITARGAWECVKRHFREIGVDIQAQDFTCAGIGDMSGDVFGNGMLLSKHTRLVAAFDHRHIFLDPEPAGRRELSRTRAAVRAAALELGRLLAQAHFARRRRLAAHAPSRFRSSPRRAAARISTPRRPRRWKSCAPSCACRSTCCGTAASAPT